MSKKKRKWESFSLTDLVPIVGNGAIAHEQTGGSLAPVLLLDLRNHDSLSENLRVHEYLSPGDVTSRWAVDSPDSVCLILAFERPIECQAILRFAFHPEGVLVDNLLFTKAVYLQSARPGERLINTMDHPRVLVDVPAGDFAAEWDALWTAGLAHDLSRSEDLGRADARRTAAAVIADVRKVSRFRLPSP